MKLAIAGALAAGLLLALPIRADVPVAAAGDTVPPAPGGQRFVTVVLEGIEADSVRGPFMAGFRGAFSDVSLATEQPGVREGSMLPGVPLSARFRLLEGSPASGTWQSQVSLEWLAAGEAGSPGGRTDGLPKSRKHGRDRTRPRSVPAPPALPGVRVTYWALSPEAVAAGARVIPSRETLRFHFRVTAGPRYRMEAGRRVALLLIESLHHQSEDLDADLRLRIDDCDRGGS